jgi:GAF domain-containing protein
MKLRFPSSQPSGANVAPEQLWRERFLHILLQGSCILGFVAIVLYLLTPSPLAYKFLAIATYSILVLITLFTRLSYRIRATVFLFLLYYSGASSLIDRGLEEASMLFLGMIVMTSLLFSTRASTYVAAALTLLSIMMFGWSGSSFPDFARLTAILLTVAAMIVIGLHTFQEEFTKTERLLRPALDRLREERLQLERQVEEKTASLARKTEQLRATSYIARQTADIEDLASFLNNLTRLVTDQFGFYHAGIFLLSESGNQVVLQAASSEGGQRMVERGHALSVGTQGIVGYVAAQKKPRIALDVGTDAVFFNNPDLPLTRSEVALPLLIRNKLLGVLDIQSDKPRAFSVDDIDVLQTLSDQIAVAIDNARLVDETQAAIAQLEVLTRIRTHEAWQRKLQEHGRAFTYTPLGLRAEKAAHSHVNAISAPITLRGRKIGTISVARKSTGKWSRLDEGLLNEVAGQVGLAIDNIRLLEEATQRAMQEQVVGQLATQFSQSLDLETLLQTAARELGQLSDVSEVSVLIGQPGEQTSQPEQNSGHTIV